jgi:hypothetical protein
MRLRYVNCICAVRGYGGGLGLLGLPGLGLGAGKRKKSWTRAVFSNLQRKGIRYRIRCNF